MNDWPFWLLFVCFWLMWALWLQVVRYWRQAVARAICAEEEAHRLARRLGEVKR